MSRGETTTITIAASGSLRFAQNFGDAQLAKLAVFRLLVDGGEAAGTIWQWDVRTMAGAHYGLKGDAAPEGPIEMTEDDDPRYAEACRFGYGFSFFHTLDVALKFPFPEEGTEDYPWVRELREHGVDVVEIDDFADGCVHVVHEGSASMVWPQLYLGKQGLAGSPLDFRAFVRARMLGALPAMYEITKAGKSFTAEPGVTYSIVAKIKKSHTLKSVTTRAESWGLVISAARDDVDGSEFGVTCDDKDFRLVHVVGTSKERMEIPWQGNKLVRALDKSSIERAWSDSHRKTTPRSTPSSLLPPASPASLAAYGALARASVAISRRSTLASAVDAVRRASTSPGSPRWARRRRRSTARCTTPHARSSLDLQTRRWSAAFSACRHGCGHERSHRSRLGPQQRTDGK